MKKVVLLSSDMSEKSLADLQEKFEVIAPFNSSASVDEQEKMFLESLPRAHGIIGWGKRICRDIVIKAPKLQVVATTSVGYDALNIPLLTENGICAGNTPTVLSNTVADLALALMLAASRRIVELDSYIRKGQWTSNTDANLLGLDVFEKKLGIIGLGDIGGEVARRAHYGFRMPILYSGNSRKTHYEEEFKAQYCTLEELCRESDFIVVLCPLTPQTTELIKAEHFDMMKNTAIFVNIARGKVVDEQALISALEEKKIYAAGLDVFEQEPLTSSPLFSLPNVVMVPHIGSSTGATRQAIQDRAVENLSNVLLYDKPPVSFINPEVWDNRRRVVN